MDECGFPGYTEMLQSEQKMWTEVASGKNSVLDTLKEGGFAAMFGALWPEVSFLNKTIGCPPGSNPSRLDFNESPIKGLDGKHKS